MSPVPIHQGLSSEDPLIYVGRNGGRGQKKKLSIVGAYIINKWLRQQGNNFNSMRGSIGIALGKKIMLTFCPSFISIFYVANVIF